MCGIIACTGHHTVAPILVEGLRALEYRGYDSAGIAVVLDGSISVIKLAGRVDALAALVEVKKPEGITGIGHTRWATHGGVTDRNAHPHTSTDGSVAVVHNGIVENYLELRSELTARGCVFKSETDSEVIAHLIDGFMKDGDGLGAAMCKMAGRIRGAAAVVAISAAEPDTIAGLRLGNAGGIVCGFGEGENLLASDLLALLPHTNRIAYLESGEVAVANRERVDITNLDGQRVSKPPFVVDRTYEAAAKGAFPHFMAKEIAEQPEAVTASLRQRVSFERGAVELPEFPLNDREIRGLENVVLVGMGSSMHAGMVGAYLIEALSGIPARVDNSSEFRYRRPAVGRGTLVVAVTQSGETADTLAAMEEALSRGARRIAVTEIEGSQATRMAEGSVFLRAGQEIGVAATKTMACSVIVLTLIALHLAARRGRMPAEAQRRAVEELARLPRLMAGLADLDPQLETLAESIKAKEHLLYLGRGPLYPIALEGALKMKEIAYIHAEGYAAGEMKHGVNALISEKMPTIAIATRGPLYEKMFSNVNEVKARGGEVIALATEGDEALSKIADHTVYLPEASELISPVLALVPMQLLAYHAAVGLGLDPDKPRNLAKTVTVE
ncbi:MAG: glutamine--fructose-6-phosphate transaminase (isomerizing) [Chloroflexi bacterium]|nr:glutamine--fructose-6-phosphate transaminase (isomerizing) [Chloroflexota bacterium]